MEMRSGLSLVIIALLCLRGSAYVKVQRFLGTQYLGIQHFSSKRRASVAKDVDTGVVGIDPNNSGDMDFGLKPALGGRDEVEDGSSADGSGKVTRRKRPSFEKVLKCLILYNELKTGNRAKAIMQIHETPDDMVVEKLVKASQRKFKGKADVNDEGVAISLFLLMTPNKNFVIPDDDDRWPTDCAGIHLGQVVVDIRRKRSFKRESQKEVLDTLHFPWKPTSARFAHVLEGLAIYKEQYGDRPLKSSFMVPVVSGTKGMLTKEDDEEIDENATFDPLAEQKDMFNARQRSTGHAIQGFQANKDLIFARAKAVEDSPWPVHLMGFHLGKALRLLVEDIRKKYNECSASTPPASSEGGTAAAASGGPSNQTRDFSSVSFASAEGDPAEYVLEEIMEQVRLLQRYGVEVDLDSASASLPRDHASASDRDVPATASSSGRDPVRTAKARTTPGGADRDGANDSSAAVTAASGAIEASAKGKTPSSAPVPEAVAPEAPVKRKQGRPRRSRSEEDFQSSEPVTLAGAVKLARERELEQRSRAKAVRLPRPPPPRQPAAEGSLFSGTGGSLDLDRTSDSAAAATGPRGDRSVREMAAMRALDALGLEETGGAGAGIGSNDGDYSDKAGADKNKRKRRRLRVSNTERFSLLLEGLRVYHTIYGDHHVPVQFVVPSANTGDQYILDPDGGEDRVEVDTSGKPSLWPPCLHAFSLGKELSRTLTALKELKEIEAMEERHEAEARESGTPACLSADILERKQVLTEKKEALVALGVPLLKRRDQNFELILSALKTHDELFGDLLVPRYFVVPSEDPWAKETWGMPLGHKVRNIRYRGAYSSLNNRRRLREIGFSFEYVKEATPKHSEEKRQQMGQHWYDGAYELWEEPGGGKT